jgi:Spy/CpxP family protein refolding chaperone
MNSALKWKLAFAFLLVFVAGVTTGGLLSTLHVRRHFLGPPHSGEMGDRMREHLRRALDLTPEQAAKIAPIVDATSAKLEAIRVETAQRVRSAMEDSERQISPELTPEQQEKLHKMKLQHHKIMVHHGFTPPSPPDSPSPSP